MGKGFMDSYRTYSGERGDPESWRAAFADRMGIEEARVRVGKETPESILGVSVGATWSDIKSTYWKKAMECHPDRAAQNGMTVEAATEAFKKVVAAYTVLENRRKK